MTLDDLRARFPHLGFALFAMDPADPVTLEAYGPGGETFQWRGAGVADVLAKAFPAPAEGIIRGDGCTVPGCQRKNVPGNENVIDGKLVCDDCHAAMRSPAPAPTSVFD